MENEQQTSPASSSANNTNSRQSAPPPIPVYSGIPDRQTVQVIQQALHRQPSTAAQYLQQMYAAQQQHLMMQTAALQQQQQQHLSSAQLQSLAAVQQASLAASRQGTSPGANVPQQSPSQPPTIISRTQSVSSAPTSGITQQAVLLGNASSPALTASQAQMYLRAQMAQQNNLVQVARTLGRAVPLSPQLIFTPTATVTSVQSEVSAGTTSQSPASSTQGQCEIMVQMFPSVFQVQNLAVRGQHSLAGGLSTQSHLPSLAMKPATSSLSLQPVTSTSQAKATGHMLLPGGRGAHGDSSDSYKKGETQGTDNRGVASSRTVVPVTGSSIITPAYTHQLMQQQHQKQIQHQFVIQHQQQIQPRPALPLAQISSPLQPLTHQPQLSQCLTATPVTSQAQLEPPSTCVVSNGQRPSPVLQLPAAQPSPGLSGKLLQEGQEPPLQCRLLPQSSAVILQIQAPPGTTPPPQENSRRYAPPLQRNPCDSPSFVQMHPQPAPLPQGILTPAAVSATGTPESHRPPPDDSGQLGPSDPNAYPALDMTSGNGSSPVPAAATGTTPQNGENKPPQAVVKPQILTHVIEGFVIQEGAQPFPSHRSRAVLEVGRSSLLVAAQKKYQQGLLAEKLPQQDNNTTTTTTDSEMEETFVQESKDEGNPPKLKCELCGRVDFEYKFKRSKRFCSMACAKRYNVGCTKRVGLFHPDRSKLQKAGVTKHARRRSRKGSLQNMSTDLQKQLPGSITQLSSVPLSASSALKHSNSQEDSSQCSDNSSYEEPMSPISASSSLSRRRQSERDLELPDLHGGDLRAMNHNFLPSDPTKWNVEDVYEFIRSLPGCQDISEEFRAQEIDGQALLLLKEDHLMSAMNIKLGPALKIYARISMLRDS
ncbi:polyhomeotic-like protein 2 isoform X4 [Ascaphus truei]